MALKLHATPRVIDLVAEGFNVAIRGQTGERSDGIARALLRTDLLAVASPAYLDRRGRPASAADLDQHALILGFYGGSSPERTWPLTDGARCR